MAKEKMVGGVKVELESFDGQTNLTLWQWKMKNILIQQDLKNVYIGYRAQARSGDHGGLEQRGCQGDELHQAASFR